MITQAGDDPKVVGLVYVAAYAPEVGQSANDASSPFGWTEGQKQIRLDSQKFVTLTSEGILEDVTEGLSMGERRLALAVQGQSYGPMFDEKLTVAAWKTKPTWAIVSAKDRMLPPALEEASAKKMGAVTTTLSTCHMVIMEEPAKVAKVIDEAARNAMMKQSEIEKPEKTAELLIEMWDGANAGLIVPQEARSARNTTPTTLESFVTEVFAPAYLQTV